MTRSNPERSRRNSPYFEVVLKRNKGKLDEAMVAKCIRYLENRLRRSRTVDVSGKMAFNVLIIQALLAQVGHEPGDLDDKWGDSTEEALKDFQRAQGGRRGLGKFGRRTLAALKVAVNYNPKALQARRAVSNTSARLVINEEGTVNGVVERTPELSNQLKRLRFVYKNGQLTHPRYPQETFILGSDNRTVYKELANGTIRKVYPVRRRVASRRRNDNDGGGVMI
jgi:hypothetical protein